MVYCVGKMRNCFNIEFVHYACLCMYVHTLRNKIMTAPPYSCDKLIMALHRVIYSWKWAKMVEKVINYPCSRFNVFSSTPLFSIHSNLYNNLIFPENSNNMKACSIQRYDKKYHYRRIIHDTSWMQLMLIGIQMIAISASSCPNYRANQYFI
jgi:hypothetical protein